MVVGLEGIDVIMFPEKRGSFNKHQRTSELLRAPRPLDYRPVHKPFSSSPPIFSGSFVTKPLKAHLVLRSVSGL